LEGSPSRATDRVRQLQHALQRLERHLNQRGIAPEDANVVIAGDFNSDPGDPPCRMLRDGGLEAGAHDGLSPDHPVTTAAVAHPFKLREVYEVAQAVPAFTRKAEGQGSRPDFLFASATLAVTAVMRPLPSAVRELVRRSGLPNRALPSDHLPLGAVLRLAGR
jgi:CCR4-NOT transcription complex subunit 6